MSYCLEIKTDQGIDVIPGCYFETALLVNDILMPETAGRDEFQLHTLLLPNKRVAGLGRNRTYLLTDLPAGLSACEAAPSESFALNGTDNLAIRIKTNIFLDQGLLAHHLNLCITKDGRPYREFSLNSPAVEIAWPVRGTFIVTIGPLETKFSLSS